MKCLNCGTDTTNQKFCGRSCSAIYNNKKYPKRKPEHVCKNCQTPITAGPSYCKPCFHALHRRDWNKVTYEEICKGVPYQKHSRIRDLARKKFLSETSKLSCHICGYDKHVDVCHIKPISSFSANDTLEQINATANLINI